MRFSGVSGVPLGFRSALRGPVAISVDLKLVLAGLKSASSGPRGFQGSSEVSQVHFMGFEGVSWVPGNLNGV